MSVPGTSVSRFSQATIPTHNGTLTLVVYRETGRRAEEREHVAIVAGPLEALGGAEPVLARVHSECWTGETLGSLKCDCREQLDRALAAIEEARRGVVVYLRQEGRGIGLGNKIKRVRAAGGGRRHRRGERAARLRGRPAQLRSGGVASCATSASRRWRS